MSYFDIIGITIFPCINKFKSKLERYNVLVDKLNLISDYSEVVNEIALFREFRESDIVNRLSKQLEYVIERINGGNNSITSNSL